MTNFNPNNRNSASLVYGVTGVMSSLALTMMLQVNELATMALIILVVVSYLVRSWLGVVLWFATVVLLKVLPTGPRFAQDLIAIEDVGYAIILLVAVAFGCRYVELLSPRKRVLNSFFETNTNREYEEYSLFSGFLIPAFLSLVIAAGILILFPRNAYHPNEYIIFRKEIALRLIVIVWFLAVVSIMIVSAATMISWRRISPMQARIFIARAFNREIPELRKIERKRGELRDRSN